MFFLCSNRRRIVNQVSRIWGAINASTAKCTCSRNRLKARPCSPFHSSHKTKLSSFTHIRTHKTWTHIITERYAHTRKSRNLSMMNACSACSWQKRGPGPIAADGRHKRDEGGGLKGGGGMMMRHHMLYMCLTVHTVQLHILHGICCMGVTEKLRLTVSCARQVCMHAMLHVRPRMCWWTWWSYTGQITGTGSATLRFLCPSVRSAYLTSTTTVLLV